MNIIETSIITLLDEAWGDWFQVMNSALNDRSEDAISAFNMGFFCLEMEHFL